MFIYLQVFAASIRAFFARRRAAKAADKARQFELLDLALRRMVEVVKEMQQPVLKMTEAQQAQTEMIASWLKGFQTQGAAEIPPQAETEDDSNEFGPMRWVKDIADAHGEELPPEFRIAATLHRAEQAQNPFDREGTDF